MASICPHTHIKIKEDFIPGGHVSSWKFVSLSCFLFSLKCSIFGPCFFFFINMYSLVISCCLKALRIKYISTNYKFIALEHQTAIFISYTISSLDCLINVLNSTWSFFQILTTLIIFSNHGLSILYFTSSVEKLWKFSWLLFKPWEIPLGLSLKIYPKSNYWSSSPVLYLCPSHRHFLNELL